ncbi:creatininase family protein [Amycolatopsis sp. 195334CR]|uniref:creatininase family protein n=1 Tax=Amycolatopsis sp. 195334CR TaxID=2814588 RepID=UPI001A8DD21F|nr:creatininase family protein [Amycolatopsis sp. 195334CR]MBN6037142.1 creatininase family protein [Amycolatopsis sp. 195334CR]
MYFAELTSPEVDALRAGPRKPVLLLPVGAVEPHGPHAPLGTDPLISQGMCERAARRLHDDPEVRVLILPALPYGVTQFARGFAGGVHIAAETLFALVSDVCRALAGQGLRRVVIVNNHFEPEHVATLRRAAESTGAAYLDLVRRRNAERLTDEFRSGSCHAGQYETSLVLADRPDLVDTTAMRALPAVPVDLPSAMRAGQSDFRDMGMSAAYCGAPAEATAEEGAETFETLTTMLVETIRATATGAC